MNKKNQLGYNMICKQMKKVQDKCEGAMLKNKKLK